MTRKEIIRKYFHKIYKQPGVTIKFLRDREIIKRFGNDHVERGRKNKYIAGVDYTFPMVIQKEHKNQPTICYTLFINKNTVSDKLPYIKACLLHELGHLRNNFQSDEYVAESWALAKAYQLKDYKVIGEIEEQCLEWGHGRIGQEYKQAYDKANQRQLLSYKWSGRRIVKNKNFVLKSAIKKFNRILRRTGEQTISN
jgi:hypothetical protein